MTHNEAERLFPVYQLGKLEREQTRAFHQHLKSCEVCQSRVRLTAAMLKSEKAQPSRYDPDTQAAMARNRDLLVKLLLLMVAAWAVYRMRR